MFDLFSADTGARESIQLLWAWQTTVTQLLIDKGVFTQEEFEKMLPRVQAGLDQLTAKLREEAIANESPEMKVFRQLFGGSEILGSRD